MKYIDAEKLIAEIKRREAEAELARLEAEGVSSLTYNMRLAEENLCMFLLSFIDSLQQEQPEVDLEKEIDEMWNPRFNLGWDDNSLLSINHKSFEVIARHFYELGLNARREE